MLDTALLVAAVLVVPVLVVPAVGGSRQLDWQMAAWELHAIMQFVTVEVCASRIFLPGSAFAAETLITTMSTIDATVENLIPRLLM